MALKSYAVMQVFVDQDYRIEVTSVNMTTDGGKQRIDLLKEGFAGFSPGSGAVTIEFGLVIPRSGQEYPFQQKAAADEFATVQLGIGNETYFGNGQFTDNGINQSVNSPIDASATWVGELNPMQ